VNFNRFFVAVECIQLIAYKISSKKAVLSQGDHAMPQ